MTYDAAQARLAVHFLYLRAQGGARPAEPDRAPTGTVRREASTASPADDRAVDELAARLVRQGADAAAASAQAGRICAEARSGEALAGMPGARALSATAYDAARSAWLAQSGTRGSAGERTWPPTSQTVMARLGGGTWNGAMKAAGLPVTGAGRKVGTGSFTADEMAAVVAEFLAAKAGESFGAFTDWLARSKAADPDKRRPSAAAVRKRFGTWNAAKAAGTDAQRLAGRTNG